jgi:hypothetical protein
VKFDLKLIHISARVASSLGALLMAALVPLTAHADETMLATSPALACLTRTADAAPTLVYPNRSYERKDGGTVEVKLVFRGPNRAPAVTIDDDNTLQELVDAVKDYVNDYRLPCMGKDDEPVTLHQSYRFVPNDGRKVVQSPSVDMADAARRETAKCMINVDKRTHPEYPPVARWEAMQGRFYVKMRFDAPDQPPTLTWLAGTRNEVLRKASEEYLMGMRVPCLQHGWIAVNRIITYNIDGGPRTLLKDMSLKQFVGMAKDVPSPVSFDLNSMACPFDVRVTYLQPYGHSAVSQLDQADPARAPLLNWLSNVKLNLSEKQSLTVLGDQFTLSVPCGTINL